ncbi:1-phosphofructokinase [Paludibacterium purpuratum]|uniref:Phosphofructokinase n=1 Tax=Paludibacterium purpuratum TaxID=1144873 RepID=A0A4R7B115_9NEIS|nr:1-phosphofructokinase [Paludibacterium purpuratum]TDR76612.1 fructose-1-phosphate kinase [Paludibacterium purpuratum]
MNGPVVTVTLNPAIDQTVRLPALQHGQVNIAYGVTLNAGGKGVNVASCLADWGVEVVATGILGQDNIAPFAALLDTKGISNRFVTQPGANRVNIKLVSDDDGATTDINLPGQDVPQAVFEQLIARLDEQCAAKRWFVLAGSLPTGLADDCYAHLCERLAGQGALVALDSSGTALSAALAGASLPFCIKPNRHELEQWAQRQLPTLDDVAECALALHHKGVRHVIVSLAEQGALFVGAEGCWLATPPPINLVSSVGAGDALLAGWIAAQQQQLEWQTAMRQAMAFAAGKLARIGPHLPPKREIARLAGEVMLTRIAVKTSHNTTQHAH